MWNNPLETDVESLAGVADKMHVSSLLLFSNQEQAHAAQSLGAEAQQLQHSERPNWWLPQWQLRVRVVSQLNVLTEGSYFRHNMPFLIHAFFSYHSLSLGCINSDYSGQHSAHLRVIKISNVLPRQRCLSEYRRSSSVLTNTKWVRTRWHWLSLFA